MKKNEIISRIYNILIKEYKIKENDLGVNIKLYDLNKWDSLKQLDLIMRLESDFGFQFAINENFDIETINDFVEIILKNV
tara:strand:- start:21083 stop:21322 length:240 start_codon:yes stop_codon:yes gene_type:complete